MVASLPALPPPRPPAGMAPGKGYVDVSTVDAATSARIAAAVRAKGGAFLEAPVSGSKGPAEQGTLIFLTAGALPRRRLPPPANLSPAQHSPGQMPRWLHTRACSRVRHGCAPTHAARAPSIGLAPSASPQRSLGARCDRPARVHVQVTRRCTRRPRRPWT